MRRPRIFFRKEDSKWILVYPVYYTSGKDWETTEYETLPLAIKAVEYRVWVSNHY